MLFGDRLRTMREDKGLTQCELGKLIGVSDRVVGYYEAKVRFPKNPDTLRRISQVFRVSLDDLLGIELGSEHKTEEYFCSEAGRRAKELLKDVRVLFESDELSDREKVEFFRLVVEMYFNGKKS